jgi:hypothetical protein
MTVDDEDGASVRRRPIPSAPRLAQKAMSNEVYDASAMRGKGLILQCCRGGRWAAESGVGPDPALTERC